jgi:hypothetical protein
LAWRNVRFVIYPEAIASIPTAGWASMVLKRNPTGGLLRLVKRVAAMATVVVGFAVPMLVARAFEGAVAEQSASIRCDLSVVIEALRPHLSAGSTATPVVLASIDSGPELLYRLPVGVVPDPYHRNVEGILDSAAILGATSDEASRPLLDRHEVSYIQVCEGDPEASAFTNPDSLFRRLVGGRAGPDFSELSVPAGSGYRLYERLEG